MSKLVKIVAIGLAVLAVSSLRATEPIEPIPTDIVVDPTKAGLGKRLFFEKRLSTDSSVSCDSCHRLPEWGADARSISVGIKNRLGARNAPTVYNSTLNFRQFWDGRADSLTHQAQSPIVNPVEMGMATWRDAVDRIASDSSYQADFDEVYAGEVSRDTIIDAIVEFEKTLVTPNSPVDRYLIGDEDALSATQKRGYQLFQAYGCTACHQGANVGGNMFQKLGVLKDISLHGSGLSEDLGRYSVTKNEWDKRVFKVPSLRLAVKTPPYFHNGSVATIEEAVDIMIRFQLGRNVPQGDRDAIIAFLEALVGEVPVGVAQK